MADVNFQPLNKIEVVNRTNTTTVQDEFSTEIPLEAEDSFTSSGLLQGKRLENIKADQNATDKRSKDTTDYIKDRYIGNGDLVHFRKIEGKADDFVLIFEDEKNLSGFINYSKAVTGLRVQIGKDGSIKIYGLKGTVIDDSYWWNGKNEDDEVYKLLAVEQPDKQGDVELLFDSNGAVTEAGVGTDASKFYKLIQLLDRFNETGAEWGFRGLISPDNFRNKVNVSLASVFRKIEDQINSPGQTFEQQKVLIEKYASLYQHFKKALGSSEKANSLIYGNKDGFQGFIKTITDQLVSQAKGKSHSDQDLSRYLNEVNSFLHSIRIKSGTATDAENKGYAKALLSLVADYIGTSVESLTDLTDKAIKLLDKDLKGENIVSLITDAKLKALDGLKTNHPRFKFHKEVDNETKSSVLKLLSSLDLGVYKAENIRVFKKDTHFIIVSNSNDDTYNVKTLFVKADGSVGTSDLGNKQLKSGSLDMASWTPENSVETLNQEQILALLDLRDKTKTDFEISQYIPAELNDQNIPVFIEAAKAIKDPGTAKTQIESLLKIDEEKVQELQKIVKSFDALQSFLAGGERTAAGTEQMTKSFNEYILSLPKESDQIVQAHIDSGKQVIDQLTSERDSLTKGLIGLLSFKLAKLAQSKPEMINTAKDTFEINIKKLLIELGIAQIESESIATQIYSNVQGSKYSNINDEDIKTVLDRDIDSLVISKLAKVKEPTRSIEQTEVSSLVNAFTKILGKDAPINPSDANYVRDLAYSIKAGVKLHPNQIERLKQLIEKYNLNDEKLSKLDIQGFMALVNGDFSNYVQTNEQIVWGLDLEQLRIESLITNLINDDKIRPLLNQLIGENEKAPFNAIDLKFYLEGNRDSLIGKAENIKAFEDAIKEPAEKSGVKLNSQKITEILFRSMLRRASHGNTKVDFSSIPLSSRYFGTNQDFDFKIFANDIYGVKNKTKFNEFALKVSSFNGSIDKLDALRKYMLTKYLTEVPFDKSLLRNLKPGQGSYETDLRNAAIAIRSNFANIPGFRRVDTANNTVQTIITKIDSASVNQAFAEIDIQMNRDAKGNFTGVRDVVGADNLIKLLNRLVEDGSFNSKMITKNDLVAILNQREGNATRFIGFHPTIRGKVVLNQKFLDQVKSGINLSLSAYDEAVNTASPDASKLKPTIEMLVENFGKETMMVPDIVSIEEIMLSLDQMIKAAYEFSNETAPTATVQNVPNVLPIQRFNILGLNFMNNENPYESHDLADNKRKQVLGAFSSGLAAA